VVEQFSELILHNPSLTLGEYQKYICKNFSQEILLQRLFTQMIPKKIADARSLFAQKILPERKAQRQMFNKALSILNSFNVERDK